MIVYAILAGLDAANDSLTLMEVHENFSCYLKLNESICSKHWFHEKVCKTKVNCHYIILDLDLVQLHKLNFVKSWNLSWKTITLKIANTDKHTWDSVLLLLAKRPDKYARIRAYFAYFSAITQFLPESFGTYFSLKALFNFVKSWILNRMEWNSVLILLISLQLHNFFQNPLAHIFYSYKQTLGWSFHIWFDSVKSEEISGLFKE